jgi:hypothetical protein
MFVVTRNKLGHAVCMAQPELDNKLNFGLGRCDPASRNETESNCVRVASRSFEQFFWRFDLKRAQGVFALVRSGACQEEDGLPKDYSFHGLHGGGLLEL